MIGYMIRRVFQSIIVILGVLLITLLFFHLLPFSPARAILPPRTSQAAITQFNDQNGWNNNFLVQYWDEVKNVFTLNLGFSYKQTEGVWPLIQARLPRTFVLVGLSTLVALILSVPLGVLQVLKRNTPLDYALTGGSFVFYAMPTFFLGIILIDLFCIKVKWFPTSVTGDSISQLFNPPTGRGPIQLVLPIFTLAAVTIAGFSRYMRSSMMEQLTEDYVRTARAKGLGNRRVIYVHALRNALIPIVTLLGLSLPGIVSGALITETVFNYPGMGLLFYTAATNFDYPVLIGTTLVATVATVVGSLLADVLYAVLDPRIRYS